MHVIYPDLGLPPARLQLRVKDELGALAINCQRVGKGTAMG